METKARLSYLHISPRKVRLVTNLVKGMDVARAELELRHMSKRAGGPVIKLLKSAINHAVYDSQSDVSGLYIKKIYVDAGPVMKRMMPRAFGRGATIRKRMSHISIVLARRGQEDRAPSNKKTKKEKISIREETWKDMKGQGQETIRPGTRDMSQSVSKKKFGGFRKKIFTRKVI